MGCATGDNVRAITGSTLGDTAIEPFLLAARCILDRVAACTTAKGVSTECLGLVEGWLAAHLLTMTTVGQPDSGVKKRETFENYTVEFAIASFSGQGVLATSYGQTANALSGGCLAEADKAPVQVCFFG